MFCKQCGNPLPEEDRHCRVCGLEVSKPSEVTETFEETQSRNGSKPEQREPDHRLFKWDLNGFPTPKKTEEIDFNWGVGDSEALGNTVSADPVSGENRVETGTDGQPLSDLTEELNKFFTFDKAGEDFQKLLDKEFEKIRERSLPQDSRPYIKSMNLGDRIGLSAEAEDPRTETAEAEETPGSQLTQDLVQDHAVEAAEETPLPEMEEEEEPEVIWVSHEAQIGASKDSLGEESEEGPKAASEEVSQSDDPKVIQEESLEAVPEPIPAQDQELIPTPDPEPLQKPGEEQNPNPATNPTPAPLWFEDQNEGDNEGDKVRKTGGTIGRAVLILIIAVLLVEAAILGIQYFAPDSNAAVKAAEINTVVRETLTDWKDTTVAFFKGIGGNEETGSGEVTDPDENENPDTEIPGDPDNAEAPGEKPGSGQTGQEPGTQPDTSPAADKEALIASLSDYNKNIALVKANNTLTWKSDGDYALDDIKNSAPIENNYWTTDPGGNHVYYDKEIVATIMDFDSEWIDYVNGGSNGVIDLTKEGSRARRNVETFSKVGKVEQSFLLLEIGEIRKGENGFYVWTYEEIKEVQGSRATTKKYNWIYQLEPVDGAMKVVNYYRY